MFVFVCVALSTNENWFFFCSPLSPINKILMQILVINLSSTIQYLLPISDPSESFLVDALDLDLLSRSSSSSSSSITSLVALLVLLKAVALLASVARTETLKICTNLFLWIYHFTWCCSWLIFSFLWVFMDYCATEKCHIFIFNLSNFSNTKLILNI